MATVDMRCACGKCEGQTRETYCLSARCVHCGSEHVAMLRKGDKPGSNAGVIAASTIWVPAHDGGHGQILPTTAACPDCGSQDSWSFGTLVRM